ncbi:GntR family transcriptional regulator [Arthrobacter glacialis]|uniref:GntR family transcriptional regulator n=1 Tax=Arthrobacter glacialis TaxID=1664 RepID=A0A2S3ZY68_ARTGL|nr:GntR family transcriptional regulator [Arthrobacter glacialis]POH56916.1 GntR family transcriptional regulator [Arthrobacter glacialis]POH74191.1 GntR family transcriptional regulator [Arthrobacter glacialis]
MEAQIVIDLETATPPYEQVQTQIASLIAVGELRAGTRLPTVRSLAADLGVAAGTVARAYKGLEATGFVTTNRRQGTVVARSRQARPPTDPGASGEVMAAVDHLLAVGERAGLDGKTLISLLQGRLNQRGSQ